MRHAVIASVPRGCSLLVTRSFLVTLLTATLAASLLAQAPVAEKIDVRVINVDAYVTDRSGNPYMGLSPEDFEIFEDGVPQKLTNFYIVENQQVRRAAGTEALEAGAEFRRRIALVVDNNFIDQRERDRALAKFEEFAAALPDQQTEWSVGVIGSRFEMIQPFTSDRSQLKGAVARVRRIPVASGNGDLQRDLLSDTIRRNETTKGFDYEGTMQFANREQTYRNARAALASARGIVEATRMYGIESGKKVMFLMTGGIEINTTFAAYEKGKIDREVSDTKQEVQRLLDSVVMEANAANVTIDIIAARTRGSAAAQHDAQNSSAGFNRPGMNAKGGVAGTPQQGGSGIHTSAMSQVPLNDPIDIGDNDSPSIKIARGTGGLYLTSNVVHDSLVKAEASTARYYSLGFQPAHPEDGKYHKLSVKVKQPGYSVIHRVGYSDVSPEHQLRELLRLRISMLQPAKAVPVQLSVGPAKNADKGVLALTASMPIRNITILPDGGRYAGRVHVYVSVFDRDGRNLSFHHFQQNVVIPAEMREKALADSFKYQTAIRLEKGEYHLAVTLRDDLSREIGTAVQKVKL